MAGDGAIFYEDTFMKIATKDGTGPFTPTLLLAAVRLGIHRVTPVYRAALQRILASAQSVGIAGYVLHLHDQVILNPTIGNGSRSNLS
jgi:Peptidase family C54